MKIASRTLPGLFVAALLIVQAGLANAQALSCTAPQKPMLDVELMLGRGKANEARWAQFLAREVTPRFPDGLTVYETAGQWRDPATKMIIREKSRVLRIIVPADSAPDKVAAVAEAYKKQFRQKSVGIVTRQVCASFDYSKIVVTTSIASEIRARASPAASVTLDSSGFAASQPLQLSRACSVPSRGTGASALGLSLLIVFPFTCPVSRAHSPARSKASNGQS